MPVAYVCASKAKKMSWSQILQNFKKFFCHRKYFSCNSSFCHIFSFLRAAAAKNRDSDLRHFKFNKSIFYNWIMQQRESNQSRTNSVKDLTFRVEQVCFGSRSSSMRFLKLAVVCAHYCDKCKDLSKIFRSFIHVVQCAWRALASWKNTASMKCSWEAFHSNDKTIGLKCWYLRLLT